MISSGCTYNLLINLSGNSFTTTLPMGTCGAYYSEVDIWEKISSTPSLSLDRSLLIRKYDGSNQINSGGAIGTIYDSLP
jgi:hypothetical protein